MVACHIAGTAPGFKPLAIELGSISSARKQQHVLLGEATSLSYICEILRELSRAAALLGELAAIYNHAVHQRIFIVGFAHDVLLSVRF
jgi:hypothetical protein